MLKNRIYYQVKPYLPWRVRMGLRRIFARQKLRAYKDVWPINHAAAQPPENWPGWPDGKKFALTLTHDVEGARGIGKIDQLVALETKLGFRSSFNFVPEGEVSIPREMRATLVRNGFEVGVHDLHHDGKLFRDRTEFARKAKRINSYLSEWGSSGFRSAFMHHNLDWAHDLEILYDSSTFDTDPFEPQPDGVTTIFPFWMPGVTGRGYVELPYTLPQDSTLFLLLKESSPEIWKRKLDWIVECGGMALVNVHPDYINFDTGTNGTASFPYTYYQEFLEYIQEKYANLYWHALPRDVAKFCEALRPERRMASPKGVTAWHRESFPTTEKRNDAGREPATPRLQPPVATATGAAPEPMHAAVVLYSYYAIDPRPRRAAEALAQAGMQVDVICLRANRTQPRRETINGVNVFRLPLKRRRSGKITYGLQYLWFLVASMFLLSVWGLKRRYRLVHVHNMPDFLVFSTILPRLRGAKIILDLHDPMPELFRSIYCLPAEHFFVRWLKRLERISISFADLVLTPNTAFRELFVSRSCAPGKIQIIMNSPQANIFDSAKYHATLQPPQTERPFRLMYHGLLADRHGLSTAVRAVAQVHPRIPQITLDIYGASTTYMDGILRLIEQLNMQEVIRYHGFKPLPDIAQVIVGIDLGLVPNRLDPFTQINMPTRIFEYLAMNKPVIVPRTKGIQDYLDEDEVLFFEPENVDDLAKRIVWAHEHPLEIQRMVERGRKVYDQHRWETEEQRYLALVENLVRSPAVA